MSSIHNHNLTVVFTQHGWKDTFILKGLDIASLDNAISKSEYPRMNTVK